jgi:hypothetical protein
MNNQMQDFLVKSGEELKVILGKMANALGVAAEHLYLVLVKQEIVTGITDVIIFFAFFILMLITIKIFRSSVKKQRDLYLQYIDASAKSIEEKKFDNLHDVQVGRSVFFGFMLGALIITNLCLSYYDLTIGIKRIINPEYYAIQDAVNFVHGQVSGTTDGKK